MPALDLEDPHEGDLDQVFRAAGQPGGADAGDGPDEVAADQRVVVLPGTLVGVSGFVHAGMRDSLLREDLQE
jgi:hypothetical protein